MQLSPSLEVNIHTEFENVMTALRSVCVRAAGQTYMRCRPRVDSWCGCEGPLILLTVCLVCRCGSVSPHSILIGYSISNDIVERYWYIPQCSQIPV